MQKVKQEKSSDTDEQLSIQMVKSVNKIAEQLKTNIKIYGVKRNLRVQIDTGAEANILPTRCFKQIYPGESMSDHIVPNPLTILKENEMLVF